MWICLLSTIKKGIVMKRQWIPLVATAMFVGALTVRAEGPYYLPPPIPGAGGTLVRVQAAEPVAAPKGAAIVAPATPVVITEDCCPDQQPRRQRREKFNLCDYWQILCACFYHG